MTEPTSKRQTVTSDERELRGGPPLHQLQAARRRQGMTVRCLAKRLRMPVSAVRYQEQSQTDISLRELYRWQAVLEVPICELLVGPPDSLSRHVLERARLLRVMKTARSIRGAAGTRGEQELADLLIEQLLQMMPEFATIASWPSVGQRRTGDELGRVAEDPVSDHWLSREPRADG